jgi:CheY-like chemotaxis protein
MGGDSGTTILVVDDETEVRNLVRRFLQVEGYRVIDAGSGEEALVIFAQKSSTIALLITDIMMPGITGIYLAQQIRRIRPALPVILISGYCGQSEDLTYVCLKKPFDRAELIRRVAESLNERDALNKVTMPAST